MKKMTKKKIGLLVILIFLIVFVGGVYNAFNGNPISKYITKVKIESYIEDKYKDKDYYIVDMGYNFKFGTYYAQVESRSSNIYFNIEGKTNGVRYDEMDSNNVLDDYKLMNKFEKAIKEEIEKVISEECSYVSVITRIVQNKYEKNKDFSLDMDDEFYIQIMLKDNVTDEVLIENTYEINEKVKSLGLKGYKGIKVIDDNDDVIFLEGNEVNIPKDELRKKIGKEDYNEDLYKRFHL